MSEIKVNKISPRSGTTVTLGDSGDTFTIPSGATINNQGTATNFGATGSASWTTTVKTNSDSGFTAVAGEGYFCNTTAGTISVNLPAGTAGAVVAFKDYASTFQTNNLTLVQNGSDKIGGSTVNAVISTEGVAITLVFIDSVQGWLITDDGTQSLAVTNPYLQATGGTITCSGNFKIHTFTGPGTFTVTKVAASAPDNIVEYLVVAGGGSGGKNGGGGGAGGTRFFANPACAPGAPALPLNGPAGIPVTATSFPIDVGGGGVVDGGSNCVGGRGNNSTFSTIISTGGGGGGNGPAAPGNGPGNSDTAGGSGGGAGRDSGPPVNPSSQFGRGQTPPTSPAQGTDGGSTASSAWSGGGGGGGFINAGGNGGGSSSPSTEIGGNGGAGGGLPAAIFGANGIPCGSYRYYGGGGGGGINGSNGSIPTGANGSGGLGGGGAGFIEPAAGGGRASVAGTINTGGGGGGGTSCAQGGGSGIVVIRYRFQ
jgi:hypothetical protein